MWSSCACIRVRSPDPMVPEYRYAPLSRSANCLKCPLLSDEARSPSHPCDPMYCLRPSSCPLMRRPGIIVRRRFLLAHAPPHLRHTVRQLLMVHGHALGLVQRHQCSLQEALNAWRHGHGRVSMACKTSDHEHGLPASSAPCRHERQHFKPPRLHLVRTLCSSFRGSANPLMIEPRISSSSATPLWCSVSKTNR